MRDLKWLDTRDMTGDGHTKGSIPRLALWQLAAGQLHQLHPSKSAAIKAAPGTFSGTHFFCVALPAMPPPGTCQNAAGFDPFGQLLNNDDVQVTSTYATSTSRESPADQVKYNSDLDRDLHLMCWHLGHTCQCPGFTPFGGPGKMELNIEELQSVPKSIVLTAIYHLVCIYDASLRDNNTSYLFENAELYRNRSMKTFCKGLSHWGGIPPQAYPIEAAYPDGDTNLRSYREQGEAHNDYSFSFRFGCKRKGRDQLETTDWADAGNEEYSAVINIIKDDYEKLLQSQKQILSNRRWNTIHLTWLALLQLNKENRGDIIEIFLACTEHSGAKYLGIDMNCKYRIRLCGLYSLQDTTTPYILRSLGYDLATGKATVIWGPNKLNLWYSGPNNMFEPFSKSMHLARKAARESVDTMRLLEKTVQLPREFHPFPNGYGTTDEGDSPLVGVDLDHIDRTVPALYRHPATIVVFADGEEEQEDNQSDVKQEPLQKRRSPTMAAIQRVVAQANGPSGKRKQSKQGQKQLTRTRLKTCRTTAAC